MRSAMAVSGVPRHVFTVLQVLGTVAILVCVPSNAAKAAALPCWWLLTFQKLQRSELFFYAVACAFFTVMDVLSVGHGIFAFEHPDVLGLPFYEPLLWGFYIVHTLRAVRGPEPRRSYLHAGVIAVLFSAAFSVISDAQVLLGVTSGLLLAGLILFHDREDIAYVAYMIFLGAVFEYSGVWSRQWSYTNPPLGGVPPWFITLWGGVGLLVRRLALPAMADLIRWQQRKQAEPVVAASR